MRIMLSLFQREGRLSPRMDRLCAQVTIYKKGVNSMPIKLRPWQQDALIKALGWLLKNNGRQFLINAAPGSGKTITACAIAQALIDRDVVDRVVVIAPRKEVVNQWANDYKMVTGRAMTKVTAGDSESYEMDVCATWSAIQGLVDVFQAVCRHTRVLVICDEHHHAAVRAAWGDSADGSFADAKFSLILTGTPMRSDAAPLVWVAYDDAGEIKHPEKGTYTLTYGEAIEYGYCRPATFHRHEGNFRVDVGEHQLTVSGRKPAIFPNELARIPALQRALDFYRLACTRQFDENKKPDLSGYQATMLEEAGTKLTDLRYEMPEAGGLVIAPNIEMADYMSNLICLLEGEKPMLVHSRMPNPDRIINAFRGSKHRWLVSVAMVSEGVDIKKLRVLVYLPNALTELAFRQAVGRVVRSMGPDDMTRAYIVMPSFEILENYACRVEEEIPHSMRGDTVPPTAKLCPVCGFKCERGAKVCTECGHEFPAPPSPKFKNCGDCGEINPLSATTCQTCGASFEEEFILTLEDALRDGAIIRGMDFDEEEVQLSEKMMPSVRREILKSGDENLIRVLKVLPEESISRLHLFLKKAAEDK